jgi:hypothetical protein
MSVLQIGQTSIPYTVRYSSRTKRQRILVTPEAVEVVAHEFIYYTAIMGMPFGKR